MTDRVGKGIFATPESGRIAAGASLIAKILFFIFLVVFIIALIGGLTRRRPL